MCVCAVKGLDMARNGVDWVLCVCVCVFAFLWLYMCLRCTWRAVVLIVCVCNFEVMYVCALYIARCGVERMRVLR
jgi:hypothetical protein